MAFDFKIPATEGREADPDEAILFKALSHPLRFRMMMILGEREASPKELSEALEAGFHKTWEHVKRLEGWGLIELVDTDHKNGGEQHFYRARTLPVLDAEEWDRIPEFARKTTSAAIIRTGYREVTAAIEGGHFDSHPSRVVIRKPLLLDEEGMQEADAAGCAHLAAIEEAEAKSAARRIKTGEPATRVMSLVMTFPAAPSGS